MPSSLAPFDFIYLIHRISARLGYATNGEVHLFAYLGCLLSLFDGKPVADWGYEFAGLEAGAPYSAELQQAEAALQSAGLINKASGNLVLTPAGAEQLNLWKTFSLYSPRLRYLDGACSTLLSLPIGMVRSALSMEPGLRPVSTTSGMRPLLAETSISQLHDHFNALLTAVGQSSDLIIPATLWLTYLSDQSRQHDRELVEFGAANND